MNYSTPDSDKQFNSNGLVPELPTLIRIPKTLNGYTNWVCWVYETTKDGRLTRRPVSETLPLHTAYKRCMNEGLGLGFNLTSLDPFAVVTIDDYDQADPSQYEDIIKLLKTYTIIDKRTSELHMMGYTKGIENAARGHISIHFDSYMVPFMNEYLGLAGDVQDRTKEFETVARRYCPVSWMKKFEALGDHTEEHMRLDRVLSECLDTQEWLENGLNTELFPFIARCYAYPALKLKIRSHVIRNYLGIKTLNDIEQGIKPYMPGKRREKISADGMSSSRPANEYSYGETLHGAYQLTEKGGIKESQANWEIMLEEEPYWRGRLRLNTFHQKVELDGESLSEQLRAEISSWASRNLELSGGNVKNRDQAILVVAAKDTFDPLQDYINGLPAWDRNRRLEGLFKNYYVAEETAYTKWLGRMMFTSMIARALSPACICRYAVILKGPQNIGKSESVRAIGGEYTTELSGNLGSRDAQIQMRGVWVVELGELNSIRKSHRDEAKRFISARYDEFTLKHQNDAVRYPRRCIFIGTGNADEVLNDPTGSTRWFPVNVTKAHYQGIERDRNQLFAEALLWYREHINDWWVIPGDVQIQLDEMREESRSVGAYEEKLIEWLTTKPRENNVLKTTWPEIASSCLNLPEGQWKGIQTDVTDSLRAMGWRRKKEKKNDGTRHTHWVWYPPEGWLDDSTTSKLPDWTHTISDDVGDDPDLPIGREDWATEASYVAKCYQCSSVTTVGKVTGLCEQCSK